jgi:hypothetical protein
MALSGRFVLGCLSSYIDLERAVRTEHVNPHVSLSFVEDCDCFPSLVNVVLVRQRTFSPFCVSCGNALSDLLFLLGRQIQAVVEKRSSEHRAGAFPLKIDLVEAGKLPRSEILAQEQTHFLIDGPSGRRCARVFPSSQEHCPALKCDRGATAYRDLLGVEFEISLNIRAGQEKDRHGAHAKTVIQWLSATRRLGESAEPEAQNEQGREDRPSMTHDPSPSTSFHPPSS